MAQWLSWWAGTGRSQSGQGLPSGRGEEKAPVIGGIWRAGSGGEVRELSTCGRLAWDFAVPFTMLTMSGVQLGEQLCLPNLLCDFVKSAPFWGLALPGKGAWGGSLLRLSPPSRTLRGSG